jgi:hypothetical protein
LFAGKALALFARLLGPGAHRQRRRHDGESHRFGQGCNEFAPRRRSLTCRTGSRLIAHLSEGYPETEGRQMSHPQSGECERKDAIPKAISGRDTVIEATSQTIHMVTATARHDRMQRGHRPSCDASRDTSCEANCAGARVKTWFMNGIAFPP